MQLADFVKFLATVGECAEATHVDADLRLAWIGHYTQETMAAAAGDYTTADKHKARCNALADLMRLYVSAAARPALGRIKPIVLGGEGDELPDSDDEINDLIGRETWTRPGPPAPGEVTTNGR